MVSKEKECYCQRTGDNMNCWKCLNAIEAFTQRALKQQAQKQALAKREAQPQIIVEKAKLHCVCGNSFPIDAKADKRTCLRCEHIWYKNPYTEKWEMGEHQDIMTIGNLPIKVRAKKVSVK